MAVSYNSRIVTNGLVLAVDAANMRSYPGPLGGELVANTFLSKVDGITYKIFRDATISNTITLCSVTANSTYYVDYYIPTYTGGTGATFRIAGSSLNLNPVTSINAGGRYRKIFTSNNTSTLTIVGDNAGTDFDLDYVSVKEAVNGINSITNLADGSSGTIFNAPSYSSSDAYGAFTFAAASNNYIDMNTNFNGVFSAGITMQAWVKVSSYASYARTLTISTSDNLSYHYWLQTNITTGAVRFGAGSTAYSNGTTAVGLNTWAHMAATCDYGVGSIKLYLNGAPDVGAETGTPSYAASVGNTYIGRLDVAGTPNYSNFTFGSAQIYNRALSADEILQNYNAQKGRYGR